jgi:hypothetical protein
MYEKRPVKVFSYKMMPKTKFTVSYRWRKKYLEGLMRPADRSLAMYNLLNPLKSQTDWVIFCNVELNLCEMKIGLNLSYVLIAISQIVRIFICKLVT